MKPSLIVHGGAWPIPAESFDACRAGIRRALDTGWKILTAGGAAIDAVESAIVVLEEDPTFDAGVGSHLNLDGVVQLDAILMDGTTLKSGAVAAVEHLRNPIRAARRVLESSKHMMFVGPGAEKFAVKNGLELCANADLITPAAREFWKRCHEVAPAAKDRAQKPTGTVGAVALDRDGRLVAGTSTGGTPCKAPGRIGDSPLIGCGCYADAEAAGVSCTGQGEGIMRIVMAKMAVDLLRSCSPGSTGSDAGAAAVQPQEAADACVRHLAQRAKVSGGLILLDRLGRPAAAFNTPGMAYGFVEPDGTFQIVP